MIKLPPLPVSAILFNVSTPDSAPQGTSQFGVSLRYVSPTAVISWVVHLKFNIKYVVRAIPVVEVDVMREEKSKVQKGSSSVYQESVS